VIKSLTETLNSLFEVLNLDSLFFEEFDKLLKGDTWVDLRVPFGNLSSPSFFEGLSKELGIGSDDSIELSSAHVSISVLIEEHEDSSEDLILGDGATLVSI